MGLRGPGAGRRRRTIEEAPKRDRRFPWKAKGLTRAQRVIKFVEWLPVTKGIKRGKRVKLLPSQREFIEQVYATDKTGKRKVSLAITSEPKGNGKSSLVSYLSLCHLLGSEADERGAVYSASIDRGKAGIIYDEMRAIVLRVPEFARRVNIVDFNKKMVVLEGDGFDSTFEALSADARRSQGLAPSFWAYDELGEAPDGALISVLMESEGKRAETLGIVLSTQAESDDHPLSRLIDDALTGADPSVYLQLHAAPPDADPFDDETIKACNPAYGKFLDLKAIQRSRDRARRIPSLESSYRRLRLNQRVPADPEARLVTASVWKDCGAPVDRAALRGRRCFGGLDLSLKHDLCSLVLAFPTDDLQPTYDVLAHFWTPLGQLEARQPAERERFREWIKAGHLTGISGPVVQFSHVAGEIARLADEFQIMQIAYDRWRIDLVKQELGNINLDLPLVEFGQGHSKPMATAIEFFTGLALTGRIRGGAHPVLTASIVNAIVTPDKAGNQMIDKPKSNRRGPVRVDGAIALMMALGTARGYVPPKPPPNIAAYLDDPVMVI
jgi:phage terminase large subunit-like protein